MVGQTNWSGPFYLQPVPGVDLGVDSAPGVYRIRAFAVNGEPLNIPRLGGVDSLGILHIGKSVNLRKRILTFRRALDQEKAAHKAGNEFFDWNFSKVVPERLLRFDYIYTDTEPGAVELETRVHRDYRRTYLDRPPLDGTSGRLIY